MKRINVVFKVIKIVVFLSIVSLYLSQNIVYAAKNKTIDQAEEETRKKIAKDPNNAKLHLNLGHLLIEKWEFVEALNEYTLALKIKPNFAEAAFWRGMAYRVFYFKVSKNKDLLDQAINDFSLTIRLKPKKDLEEAAYSSLGSTYKNIEKYDKAIECFEAALEISESGDTYYQLALVYVQINEKHKASELLKKVISLENRDSQLREWAEIKLNEIDKQENNSANILESKDNEQIIYLPPRN